MAKNPLRRWFDKQPASITGEVIGRNIGVAQSYVFCLMAEDSERYPGLGIAFELEKYTKGQVRARAMYEFARKNRIKAANLKELAA